MTGGLLWIGWSGEDHMDEVTYDPSDKMGQSCADPRKEHFRQRDQLVQMPWGRNELSLFKERK